MLLVIVSFFVLWQGFLVGLQCSLCNRVTFFRKQIGVRRCLWKE